MSFSHTSTVPIHMLPGIGKRTAQVLYSLGIRTVGQFKQLPESLLVELFGPSIRSLHQYVHGVKPKSPRVQKINVVKEQVPSKVRKYKMPITKKFQLVSQLFAVL